MLKHVSHRSSSSLSRSCDFFRSVSNESPERDKSNSGETSCSTSYRQCPDNVSLTSALSFSSLTVGGRFCSRTSSTISLSEHATIPVKIYLRRLRSDMEYKTVSLSLKTTCKELIALLLSKFRLRHRDPNLFFVLMEVTVRSPSDGAPVKRQLVLDDNARPAELQQCRPKGEANFSIGVRRGGLVRVHDSVLMAGSQYKSLMVSYSTTAAEVVKLVLNCYKSKDEAKYYCLHEMCKGTDIDRRVEADEFPIQVQASWPKDNKTSWAFVLRPIIRFSISSKSSNLWRRSLDQSSTDTDSDHDTTRASIMSCSSTISHSSTSSGVSSDSCSSEISERGSPALSPTSSRSPSSITLTPESYSKISGKPPKPIPRTLFLSSSEKQSSSSDDDSGVALDEDFTPLNFSKDDSETPTRSSSLSTPSVKRNHSRYARIKSLSKSSVDLKSLPFRKESHTKSSLNLSLSGLFLLDKSPFSLPKKSPTFQATSTPKASSPTGGSSGSETESEKKEEPEKKSSLSPLRLRLSTSLRKEPSCACKSCFYI
ncbi:hypothetical protein Avbf_17726 [Armadillidium vulgare]|nr:hypothetical protein Avbf_17726 [Armadillidium vulgare]